MSHTVYASFANPDDAERAAGALIDHGVRAEDLSVVRHHVDGMSAGVAPTAVASNLVTPPNADAATATPVPTGSVYGVSPDLEGDRDVPNGGEDDFVDRAEHGITTTTAGDAGAGAVKGTVIGAGLGVVAAIAALAIPGVGFVIGAGALASALGGVAATAGAGAAAGAIVGYLKDMGVDDQIASEYGEAVESGGAVLAVTVPSGTVDEEEANAILSKYAATNLNRYASRGHEG